MSPDFARYYARELAHLRGSAHEFAQTFPKIAGRLSLDEFDCADPYVERLLEGFAFLAARVQLKIDAEFPAFIQHMLALVYPNYLAPLPSMAVVQFQPDLLHPGLSGGQVIPRGSALRGMIDPHGASRCAFRTAHAMTLFPVEVVDAKAFPASQAREHTHGGQANGRIRLRLRAGGGRAFSQTGLDRLSIHLRGSDALPMRIYEKLVGSLTGIVVTPVSDGKAGAKRDVRRDVRRDVGHDAKQDLIRDVKHEAAWRLTLPATALSTVGFGDGEALLPNPSTTFSGYRLLQEYFGLASRFLFVEISGLAACLAQASETEVDIVFLLRDADALLEQSLSASHFALHCTPVINLFSRRIDRVAIHPGHYEHHVVADRTRPIDFEIHTIESVTGYSAGHKAPIVVSPLFEARDEGVSGDDFSTTDSRMPASRVSSRVPSRGASAGSFRDASPGSVGDSPGDARRETLHEALFFQIRRERRLVSARAPSRRDAVRSSYVGSEAFIALTDAAQRPYDDADGALQQIAIRALCTNRDLPLSMPLGGGATDFTFEGEAPLLGIRCVGGISRPAPSVANGATAWRLLNHLSLNYASLVDSDAHQGANALRDLLSLYCAPHDLIAARQVEGIRSISTQTVSRRIAQKGPMTFLRGMEVTVVLDEAAFEGGSAFLMGAVLARFFAHYVSVNSFVETVVRTLSRGEIMRWSPREGQCPTL